MVEQYDIWGGCSEVKEPTRPSRKLKTMQELHGILEGKTCGQCSHLLKFEYHDRTYHKCELWKLSHSEATDIRLKNQACKKFR